MCLLNKLFKFKTKEQIENWLYLHKIKNAIIHDNLIVDIHGDVNLKDKNLYFLPIQFGYVSGTFNMSDNKLRTLKGSPLKVGEDFIFDSNKIKSLQYAPQKIGQLCYAVDNPIQKIKKEQFNIECEEIELGYIDKKKTSKKELFDKKLLYSMWSIKTIKMVYCKTQQSRNKKNIEYLVNI